MLGTVNQGNVSKFTYTFKSEPEPSSESLYILPCMIYSNLSASDFFPSCKKIHLCFTILMAEVKQVGQSDPC